MGSRKHPLIWLILSIVASWQNYESYTCPLYNSLQTSHSSSFFLKGFYSSGKQLWLGDIGKETGLKEKKRKGEEKDGKFFLLTQEGVVNMPCVLTSGMTTWPFTLGALVFSSIWVGSMGSKGLLKTSECN